MSIGKTDYGEANRKTGMAPAIRGETNDSGSDQGGNSGSEEKWLDFRKCLKVELPYFLNMKCGRKREVKDNSVFFWLKQLKR